MIAIVLVSHSETLARGAAELAQQMAQGKAQIAVAAGTSIPEQPIGTDPAKVLAAIEEVYSDDGVLILMDLGSAIMSAEAAIEFLEPERQEKIYLCEGPLVEGAVTAAVGAVAGDDIERIFAEVRGALTAKTEQLAPLLRIPPASPPSLSEASPATPPGEARELSVVVPNAHGLHARPAARLVELVRQFDAEVTLRHGDKIARADSINAVVPLGVRQGDRVQFRAHGPDAEAVLRAIDELARTHFGDTPASGDNDIDKDPHPSSQVGATSPGQLEGIPVSPGIVVGPAFPLQMRVPEPPVRRVEWPQDEIARLHTALVAAVNDLRRLSENLAQADPDQAAIFDAHRLMLEDESLRQAVMTQIRAQSINAEAAWMDAIHALADRYRQVEDPYTAARAQDVMDAGLRVLRQLAPSLQTTALPAIPSVLIAPSISPSEVTQLDPALILGVITASGGATDHSAILLAGLAIPTVFGVGEIILSVPQGQIVALDGQTGRVWLQPSDDQVAALREEQQTRRTMQVAIVERSHQPATTQDGHVVRILANIGGPDDVRPALQAGAEGVGLFRTEFLFTGRSAPPSEEEQVQIYRQVIEMLEGRPLVVRTLDVGGDKPIPYLKIPAEANPFLGLRGIRHGLAHPDLLRTQLRALMRAAAEHSLQVMFPMISTVDEVQRALVLLEEVCRELVDQGHALPVDLTVGIMIETPAAVALAPDLARHVGFFSIGTNDLTQYVMAADRTNAAVAPLADPLQPAVLRLVQKVIQAAHAARIKISMCGALAGEPLAAPLLVGMGLDELSMAAPAIPHVKNVIRGIKKSAAEMLAAEILRCHNIDAVRAQLRRAAG